MCEANQYLVNGVCVSTPHLYTFDPSIAGYLEGTVINLLDNNPTPNAAYEVWVWPNLSH